MSEPATAKVPATRSEPALPPTARRWLALMWPVWLLATLLTVGVFIAAIPARLDQLQRVATGTREHGSLAQLSAMQLAPGDLQ